MLDRDALHALAESGDGRDRAFVDGVVRVAWARASEAGERAELEALHAALTTAAARAHGPLRSAIAAGALRGPALRRRFDEHPAEGRDHFVEEVLGVAYPPLEEAVLGPELIAYMPSGYDEILHAFELTRLGAGDRFLDIGSGAGKVVLLAALLTGATSAGLECTSALSDLAHTSVDALGLAGGAVLCNRGDARTSPLPAADVVFMYLPFTGSVLTSVIARILERPPRALCAGALDLTRWPRLQPIGAPSSWLHAYAVLE